MKLYYILYFTLVCTNMLTAKSKVSVGMSAPEFELFDQDSTIHKLTDYRGTTVILYFFPMADTPG